MKIKPPSFSHLSKAAGHPSLSTILAPALTGLRRAREEIEKSAEFKLRQETYVLDPETYIRERLGWEPWRGDGEHPGQVEIIEAYTTALRKQLERREFEAGRLEEKDLQWYRPGEIIKNRIRLETGHGVGKTKLSSGLVSHFFDAFSPSIVYTYAPTWEQIHDLLWKEIKADREGKGLPGRVLETCEIKLHPNHFAKGRATDNSGGKGTEKAQGQHGEYLMFVLDEAEGIPQFVFDAVDSMASGGIVIVLMLANPRTRSSPFHKARTSSNVQNFRISCLYHPNVIEGRESIPGAVKRDYVLDMIEKHCERVASHSEDDHTFELPWEPGPIYRPNAEFLFRVLGVAPKNITDNTLVSTGRFEAACKRESEMQLPKVAWMGADVARYGSDHGTLYIRHNGRVWRAARFSKQNTNVYAGEIKEQAAALRDAGVEILHIRVDGGGGFGGGVIDRIIADTDLAGWFREIHVSEVHNNGVPYNGEAYADLITEMYAEAAETLKGLRVENPPPELEEDLTARCYDWANKSGIAVKRLEPKEKFKKRMGRSPDDGDGFVLCVSPEYLFTRPGEEEVFEYYDPADIAVF